MKESEPKSTLKFSIDDQEFLRELGISVLSKGQEYAQRQHRAALAALGKIVVRAEELQSLELDEQTLKKLSRQTGHPLDELREKLRLFRDTQNLNHEDGSR
jgi:hypothetical protein